MRKDAIQSDVSSDDDQKLDPTPALNPRNAHLEEIAKRNRAEVEVEPEPEPIVVDDDPEPAPKAQEPEEEFETLKVEGQDVKYAKSKIYDAGKRALQKELAADKNLEESKRLRREAEELLENARLGKEQSNDADRNARLSEIAQRLQFGDQEEGQAALAEYADLIGVNAGKLDIGAISEQVIQQVDERRAWQDAEGFVKSEYPDVMNDQILAAEFIRRENQMRDDGDQRPYKDLYIAIAEDLRAYRNGLTSPTNQADTLEDRRRRKANTPPPPGGHSVSGGKPAAPEAPKSTADIIAEMRKGRGQTS